METTFYGFPVILRGAISKFVFDEGFQPFAKEEKKLDACDGMNVGLTKIWVQAKYLSATDPTFRINRRMMRTRNQKMLLMLRRFFVRKSGRPETIQ
jgi:hypothetical protein